MTNVYKFRIDPCHLPSEIVNIFDHWAEIDVELTDEEVTELLKTRKEWLSSEEFKNKGAGIEDDEYYLYKFVPGIHEKMRKVLEEQAPLIWSEKIIPEIDDLDIYLPKDLDWMELDEWEEILKNRT
jgi:hypothetical protein